MACLLQENVQCSSVSVLLDDQETPDECASVVNSIGYEYFSFGKSGDFNRTCVAEATTTNCTEGVFSDDDFDFYTIAESCALQNNASNNFCDFAQSLLTSMT